VSIEQTVRIAMQLHHNALVLVADGQRSRFLRNLGNPAAPRLVVEGEGEHIGSPTHEQGSDAPGRAFSSVGQGRSAFEQTDFHQIEKDNFAARIAEILAHRAKNREFEEVIVIAPPRTLAELRGHYTREVTARLAGEIDKDLTKHDPREIAEIVANA
jgi:protein required for attachment to host cells